jgi:hypothetical protein
MKIKNILYVASFMVFTGLNAAERLQEVVVGGAAPRTQETVLREFALLAPVPPATERGFWSTAGGYGGHILKYPVIAGALCLPFIMKCKNNFFSSASDSIDWLVYGAVGAATVVGIVRGKKEAEQQFETEDKLRTFPVYEARLQRAAGKIAELENVHGSLNILNVNILRQEANSAHRAEEQRIQIETQRIEAARIAAVQSIQFQAEAERLRCLVEAQTRIAESTASNIAVLRGELENIANQGGALLRGQLGEQFDRSLRYFEHVERLHAEILAIENGSDELTMPEKFQKVAAIKRRHEGIAVGREVQSILTSDISALIAKLPEHQQAQLMNLSVRYSVLAKNSSELGEDLTWRIGYLENHTQSLAVSPSGLELGAAAAADREVLVQAVFVPAVVAVAQPQQAQNIRPPMMAVRNYFGGLGVSQMEQHRPVTPAVSTMSEIAPLD